MIKTLLTGLKCRTNLKNHQAHILASIAEATTASKILIYLSVSRQTVLFRGQDTNVNVRSIPGF